MKKNYPLHLFQEYFEKFGEIEHVKLKMDPMTGRSRGFAFLLYKDVSSIEGAADGSEHKIKVGSGLDFMDFLHPC